MTLLVIYHYHYYATEQLHGCAPADCDSTVVAGICASHARG